MSLRASDAARCGLQDAAGRVEACPGADCPFWDGVATLGGGCAIERLVARLEWSPELAHFLLALRRQLEDARAGRSFPGSVDSPARDERILPMRAWRAGATLGGMHRRRGSSGGLT